GIIGRNGAGKSTLLKILSRITEPTTGRVEIRGRVGSLLEVGTGFHPELTGRENVYLNGAILGMKRAEVDKKFDEIVAFAEIEKFIDTPVKRYSSGMYLRLAFAVASNLDAEILLVDEVLAVGDAKFQQRCMGKIGSVAAGGRTVLFVSHNLSAVRELCPKSMLIDNGTIRMYDNTNRTLLAYGEILRLEDDTCKTFWWNKFSIEVLFSEGASSIKHHPIIRLRANLNISEPLQSGYLIAVLEDAFGRTVVNRRVEISSKPIGNLQTQKYLVEVSLYQAWLAPGAYAGYFKLIARTRSGDDIRRVSARAFFEMPGNCDGIGKSVIVPPCEWAIQPTH
ncbi:MAG: ABC transporter ATP-binding protein, partial [Desulfomonilaceae bacterium]